MATVNTITDQYIIKASVDDQASAGIEKLSVKLGAYETAARSAMSAAEKMADTAANGGVKFEVAAAQFDRYAKKYDDVTAAAAKLAAAQRELEQVFTTGQRAVANGTATQEAFEATTAGLSEKISTLATALGKKRAEAAADQAATEAWNGSIGKGGQLAGAFADQVMNVAETTKAAQIQFSAWMASIDGGNTALTRANTGLKAYVAAQDALRGSYDATFKASADFRAELANIQGAVNTAGLRITEFAAANDKARASFLAAGGELATVATKDEALAASKAALTVQIDAWNAATIRATESQRLWNATSGVTTDAEAAARTEARAADMDALSVSMLEQRAALLPLIGASKDYSDAWGRLDAAVKVGLISQDEATVQQEALSAAFAAANQPLEAYNAELAATAAQIKATAATQTEAATRLDALAQKYDPVYRAQTRYKSAIAEINELEIEGKLAYDAAAAARAKESDVLTAASVPALGRVSDASKKLTAEQNLQTFASRQLGVQTIQFFSSLEGGTPIMLAAVQQGHQLIDVALATGTGFEVVGAAIKKAWTAVAGWVVANPAIAAIVTLTAASVALVSVEQSHEAELNTLQQRLRGVTDDYRAMAVEALSAAHAIAQTSNISLSDAKTGAGAFAAAPGITGIGAPGSEAFNSLVKTAGDASVALGISVPDAMKKFADAILDVGPMVTEFAGKSLFGMNAEFERSVKVQVASGDALGAYQRVVDQVTTKTNGALEPATKLGEAWEKLKQSFTGAGASGESLSSVLGNALSAMAQTSLRLMRELVDALDWVRSKFKAHAAAMPTMPDLDADGRVVPQLNIAKSASSVSDAINAAAKTNQMDPALLAALQRYENRAPNLDGTWATSATGALGPMQVLQSTFDGMQKQPNVYPQTAKLTDLTDPTQNVIAGSELFSHLLGKYNSVRVALLAYHDGESVVDNYLKSPGTRNPEIKPLSAAAVAEADGVMADYGRGSGRIASPAAATASNQAVLDQQAVDRANRQAQAGGAPAFASDAAAAQVANMEKGLAALGRQGITSGVQFDAFTQELNKNKLALQNAIPATDAQGQALNREVAAAEAMTAAYAKGLPAVALQTAHNLALTQVNDKLARGTAEYNVEVERLTQVNLRNAAAHGGEAAAADLAATVRQTEAVKSITAARLAGLPAVAQEIAYQAAKAKVEGEGLLTGEAATKAIREQTQANLDASQVQGADKAVEALTAKQRHTEAIKAETAAIAAGLPAQAEAIARETERAILIQNNMVPGTKAFTDALDAATQANLAEARAAGSNTMDNQAASTDRATAATLRVAAAYRISEAAGAAMEARVKAETDANNAGLAGTEAWTTAVEKNTAATLASVAADAQKALSVSNIPMERTIANNNTLAAAYAKGGQAVAVLTATEAAQAQLISAKLYPNTLAYNLLLADQVKKNLDVAASAEKLQSGQEAHSLDNSITMIKAETASLGMNADQRTLLLAHMQSEMELRDKYKASYDTEGVAILKQRDNLAALTLAYQNTQTNLSYVAGQFTQAFDTIGNAMTQAFVQGQGAAVNWGNVMKSVVQQVIQQLLKLAVLNPIINSLFNQNNPTLDSVVSALGSGSASGGTSGSAGGFGGVSNLLSLGGTASSVSGALGGPTISSALGLTGPNGLMSSLGLGNVGSSITGFLGTNTGIGAVTGASAVAPEGAYTAAQVAASSTGGASIGALAGGAGLGFGAGSLVGGYLQSAMGKTGPAPTIGAGGGAIAGAIIGSSFGPAGTLIGGLLGGLVGGAGGSLIGPHIASAYSSQGLSVNNGQFATGARLAQMDERAGAAQAQAVSDTNNINAFMAANKVLLTSLGKITQLGDNTPGGFQDPSKATDINAAFSQFRFSSGDPIMADKLIDKSFGSADEFQAWVTTFAQVQASAKAYLTDITAVMKDLGAVSGSLPDSIGKISAAYDVDKTAMDALIASGDLSAQQTTDMAKAETDLASVRDKTLKQLTDQVIAHYTTIDAGLTARQLTANATLSGSSADVMNQQLYVFDTNAPDQRASLKADLISIYGDAVTTTEGFAQQMALLETTLGQERLVIVANYAKQLQAANDTVIANDNSVAGRAYAAQASLSGNPADLLTSQLYSFDVQAQTQRAALSKQLIDTYGSTITSTRAYTDRMANLERVLGQERLVVATQASAALAAQQKAASNQAASAAASAIKSLATWAASLATSSSSPLSPLLKLQSAQSAFNDTAAQAKAGDASAVGDLQTTGSTLLAAAQAYYGSSTGYTAIFDNVVTALKDLAATPPDTLTASFLALQTQTQTQTLVDALAALQAEVTRLRADVNRNSAAPARLAA